MKTYKIFVEYGDKWHEFGFTKATDEIAAMNHIRSNYKEGLEILTGNSIEYVNLDWEEVSE